MMDPREYELKADQCLERIANWLEEFDPDEVDFAASDGVLTIEFPDGARYILNRQAASHQMWYAAGSRAWHYNWSEGANDWQDDRDEHTLDACLAKTISDKIGRSVTAPN